MIINWYGSIASIPVGFVLCDGSNGTPDLRDKFIVGAKQDDHGVAKSNIEGSLKATGGANDHDHDVGSSGDSTLGAGTDIAAGATFENYIATATTGYAEYKNNIPVYYALAYIMKT